MAKKEIDVQGFTIKIENDDYISLTDLIKSQPVSRPANLIFNWLKNQKTLRFLETWESVHNPDFNTEKMKEFRLDSSDERFDVSPQRYIAETKAIGLVSKSGRYGGTYAHKDIAINFCYWLSPEFQVYLIKEFERLKRQEFEKLSTNQKWHISKITDYVDNARVLLDSIPGQLPENIRVNLSEEE